MVLDEKSFFKTMLTSSGTKRAGEQPFLSLMGIDVSPDVNLTAISLSQSSKRHIEATSSNAHF